MVSSHSNERRVVREWADDSCPTGEYKCQDDRGTVWRVHLGVAPPRGTGEMHGVKSGDTITITGG